MKKLLLIFILAGCANYARQFPQGIEGQIFWWGGNQMPGPGANPDPKLGIARQIHVYKAAKSSDVEQQDQFYTKVNTELITTLQTNEDGTFKVNLPVGQYSVFTKEPKGLFANTTDNDGCISCVVVKEKKFTHLAFTVDYEAAY